MILDRIPEEIRAVPYEMQDCARKILGDTAGSIATPLLSNGTVIPYNWGTYIVAEDIPNVKLIVAIMYVESRWRPELISRSHAYGLMQMTAPAVAEAAEYCGLPVVPTSRMLQPQVNIRYGACYLRFLQEELDDDLPSVLVVYNGGTRQLLRYRAGLNMASETANYLAQVLRTYNLCEGE